MPRPQFTLRALLVATSIVCLGLTGIKCTDLAVHGALGEWYALGCWGGMVIAGAFFGGLVGAFFREPVAGAVVGVFGGPVIGVVVTTYFVNWGC